MSSPIPALLRRRTSCSWKAPLSTRRATASAAQKEWSGLVQVKMSPDRAPDPPPSRSIGLRLLKFHCSTLVQRTVFDAL